MPPSISHLQPLTGVSAMQPQPVQQNPPQIQLVGVSLQHTSQQVIPRTTEDSQETLLKKKLLGVCVLKQNCVTISILLNFVCLPAYS